jgi:hypothetical protein
MRMARWSAIIKTELCRLNVLPENVYNIGETCIMFSILGFVNVQVFRYVRTINEAAVDFHFIID